eukprot:TRINITY_DN50224_c0_g1_i1.p1 TRINITY_DN50224_c0_g1~~TRINITY_DN50224_c0_g1_i1.p1  ORF type:complete len:495 (+),score=89.24 TRINITY_DN50224_c0_g1_i1:97-1581(+)
MPGPEAAEEHIPNLASAAFNSKQQRLVTKPALTASVDYASPEVSASPRRCPDHSHVFRSGSPRFKSPVPVTKDVDVNTPPGIAAKASGAPAAVFRARSPRWSSKESVTKDVEPYIPKGVGDATGKGIPQWQRAKSPRNLDSEGYPSRFRDPQSATMNVQPFTPKGMGAVDASHTSAVFHTPRSGKADRFRSPRPVTADVEPFAHPGIAEHASQRRLRGAAQPRAKRFVDRAPLTKDVDTYYVPQMGKDARGVTSWSHGSKRFTERVHPTANVDVHVDAHDSIAHRALRGKSCGIAQTKAKRFPETMSLTATVEPCDYSSIGRSKQTGSPSPHFRSSSRRFRQPTSVTKDVDHYTGGGMAEAVKGRSFGSANFKSNSQRFRQPPHPTALADWRSDGGLAHEVSTGHKKGGATQPKAPRFRDPRTHGPSELQYDTSQSLAARVVKRAASGAPGMRSRSPRFVAKKAETRPSEEQSPVRGLAYVITHNQNTFNSRHR